MLDNMSEAQRDRILAFYNETKAFEAKIGVLIPSIFATIIAIGLVGNVLVIIVALNRQMRNSTNTLIIGLAVSDLLFLTLCVPFTAVDYALPVFIFPPWCCKMINYLQHASAYASVWTLTLMACDRYLAVVFPIASMTWRSTRNTSLALICLYTVIGLTQVPVADQHDIYFYDFIIEQRSTCAIVSIATGTASISMVRLYFFSFNVFGYVFPLGITCCLYYFMLRRLWHLPKPGSGSSLRQPVNKDGTGSTTSSTRTRPETVKAKKKVTRLVLFVVITWAFCWFPLNVCFFCSGVFYPDTLVSLGGKPLVMVQISSQVLAYCNSCLNPILYAFLSENFRKGFVRVISLLLNTITCGHFCIGRSPRLFGGSRMDNNNRPSCGGVSVNNNQLSKSTRSSLVNHSQDPHRSATEQCALLREMETLHPTVVIPLKSRFGNLFDISEIDQTASTVSFESLRQPTTPT